MLSTVLNRAIISVVLAGASGNILARDEGPPRILQEPMFGLRYVVEKVHFDPVPDFVRAACSLEHDKGRAHFYLYAIAHDAARTFVIVGGYVEAFNPAPNEHRYELNEPGILFVIDKDGCMDIDEPRNVFNARYFDQVPQAIHEQLARDLSTRLERAFGGPERLRSEWKKQGIEQDKLPIELRDAFKIYLGK
ncbi:MAG: hypothetical protein V4582_10400 [Pseudomonadota bacterium]